MKQPPESRPSVFVSRRNFIQLGLASVGAAWAGAWLQTQLFPASGSDQEAQPVTFPLSELPVGEFRLLLFGGSPAIVLRTPASVRAFSLICTHLGCTVQWQPEKKEFYCPCHDGRFDEFGEVLAGPPPIPLEQIALRVEGDQVILGEA